MRFYPEPLDEDLMQKRACQPSVRDDVPPASLRAQRRREGAGDAGVGAWRKGSAPRPAVGAKARGQASSPGPLSAGDRKPTRLTHTNMDLLKGDRVSPRIRRPRRQKRQPLQERLWERINTSHIWSASNSVEDSGSGEKRLDQFSLGHVVCWRKAGRS